jgi:hypothetical protein
VVRHLCPNAARGHVPDGEIEDRELLIRISSAKVRPPDSGAPRWPELQRALQEAALEHVSRYREFEVWARP